MVETFPKTVIVGWMGFVGMRFLELSKEYSDQLILPSLEELDITDPESVSSYIRRVSPQAILNFAAYTNVKEAQNQIGDQNGEVWKLNVEGPKNLAQVAADFGLHLVQISTDGVFPGSDKQPGPYDEDNNFIGLVSDEEMRFYLTWYGYTKLYGEEAIRQVADEHPLKYSIGRISFPFGALNPDKDYLMKMVKTLKAGYGVFDDQTLTPTFLDDLVGLQIILSRSLSGNFHIVTHPVTTPYQIAQYLAQKLDLSLEVKKGLLKDLEKADRPRLYTRNGGLKSDQTEDKLGIKFHTWQEAVDICCQRYENQLRDLLC